jgi:hypothetical protein
LRSFWIICELSKSELSERLCWALGRAEHLEKPAEAAFSAGSGVAGPSR